MPLVTAAEVKTFSGLTATYDTEIGIFIPIVEDRISKICNNYFWEKDVRLESWVSTFTNADPDTITSDSNWDTDGHFAADDDFVITGSWKNDGFRTIASLSTTTATLTSSNELVDEAHTESDVDAEYVYFTLVNWPDALKDIASQMIRFDIINRPKRSGVRSESIGNYSVTFETGGQGTYGYPDDIIGHLKTWMRPRFI